MGRPTLSDALERMRRYCAQQDRAHSEVRNKLVRMQIYGDDLEEIISDLVTEGFLNEERFARSFARGKFRMNHWGRFKIRMHLKQKGVSEYSISQGLEEIDEEEYINAIDRELVKKLKGATDFSSCQKAKTALIRKGFEPELVSERLRFARDLDK